MESSATPVRPNIVVVLSDDHGYGDFGRFGHDDRIRTPHLDRLAAEGVECVNAYVTAPICSPSRSGLIAGAYQQRWGATWFGTSRFPDERTVLPERFGALGYATGYLGKVHYGREQPGDRACPPNHGFDESFYGLAGRQMGRLNYLRHSRAAVEEYGEEASWRMAVLPLWENGVETEFEGFLTAEIGRRARQFVDDHAEVPFFLMLSFNAVHNFCAQLPDAELAERGLPRQSDWGPGAADDYPTWYDGSIWPELDHGRDYYAAQLELMDAEVGGLLQTLEDRGLADNTIVVYLTDNGGSTCNFGDNTPLRGGKYTLWEGGIRTPFIVRWSAGGIHGGRRCSELVSSMDLYPTLLSAAGADKSAWAGTDGVDQLDAFRGRPEPRPPGRAGHDALHWATDFQWAVREGRWKLHTVEPSQHLDDLRAREHLAVEAGQWLTDLDADPAETIDLSLQHPEIVQRLVRLHATWRHEVGMADLDLESREHVR